MRGAAANDATAQRHWRFDFGAALYSTRCCAPEQCCAGIWALELGFGSESRSLHVQTVPDYQPAHEAAAAVKKLDGIFANAGITTKLTQGRAHVTLLKKGNGYARLLKAEAEKVDTDPEEVTAVFICKKKK
jgi:hypothetical protein